MHTHAHKAHTAINRRTLSELCDDTVAKIHSAQHTTLSMCMLLHAAAHMLRCRAGARTDAPSNICLHQRNKFPGRLSAANSRSGSRRILRYACISRARVCLVHFNYFNFDSGTQRASARIFGRELGLVRGWLTGLACGSMSTSRHVFADVYSGCAILFSRREALRMDG